MNRYDLIIIGGGPAGYVGAVSACERGMKTALVEKEYLGGVCVNWGCIPTKALLRFASLSHAGQEVSYAHAIRQSMAISNKRRDHIVSLITELGGKLFTETVSKISQGKVTLANGEELFADNILIATGSTARRLPIAEYDTEHIITTREAFMLKEAPESAVVIGSGATGIEFATIWSRFGTDVTVLEMLPNIMGLDSRELSRTAIEGFKKEGIQIKTEVKVTKVEQVSSGAKVTYLDENGEQTKVVQTVLVAAGVVPVTEGLGLEEIGVELMSGRICVDQKMQTSVPGIYAAGDVTGKLALAFAATLQAKTAVKAINGEETEEINYSNISRCIFSGVEASFVGLNEKQAAEAGFDIASGITSVGFYAEDEPARDGLAKIVEEKSTGRCLGVSIIGSNAADLIAAPARLITCGKTAEEARKIISEGR